MACRHRFVQEQACIQSGRRPALGRIRRGERPRPRHVDAGLAGCRRRPAAPPQTVGRPRTGPRVHLPLSTSLLRGAPLRCPRFPAVSLPHLPLHALSQSSPPRRRCRLTSGASASAEDAGAPSHAEQAPPLPPQENGQHPYAQHPYAQHQYAQPQYAQHAMYPMMYGAQPAAGPADAHMYYAQMAGAAGAHAMPMQGAPYGMQMQQPMQMMAYGAPMGADGLADQMGGLSVQNGGVSNGGGMYHHAQMAQQRQLNGRGRGRGGYMGGFPPGYSEIPGSGVPRWGHGGGRSGGGYGGGYGGGGRGGGYGGGGSMGDDERARNGVRGLRTGAQHAVNAMGSR